VLLFYDEISGHSRRRRSGKNRLLCDGKLALVSWNPRKLSPLPPHRAMAGAISQ